ncbi:MAG: chemotaxis protein CheD [Thermodesulfobacteriota bacterium]
MEVVVGVGDMEVSNDPEVVLATYSLGSCIGLSIYDPIAKAGGMLHYMLPESSLDRAKSTKNPYMFGDTGIPLLFKGVYQLGGQKGRMKVKAVGGSQILDQDGLFNIGKRNYLLLRKIFWKNNVLIDFEDIGGNVNRTLKLEIGSGQTFLKVSGKTIRAI